jgi:hypothetical protein
VPSLGGSIEMVSGRLLRIRAMHYAAVSGRAFTNR